jgi:flagellar motor switch/type III secretory pathway protein FliN
MQPALTVRPVPYRYENLASFSRAEVALWNWYNRVVGGGVDWKAWLADVVGHLVERPAGKQLQLIETHLVDPQFGEKPLSFGAKQELIIGHEPANDIVLSANAIAPKHARLFLKEGQLHLEDLGGRLGTYVWDKKVEANRPQTLVNGDQFTVFPYRFRVQLDQAWARETDVALSDCRVQALSGALFSQMSSTGWRAFSIHAHPSGGQALLQVNSTFLGSLQERVLGPLAVRPAGSVPSDDTLAGFIVLAAIERINRALNFPVQFSLQRETRNNVVDVRRGMLLSFAVRVGDLKGQFRLFLPIEFLSQCKPRGVSEPAPPYPEGLCWQLPVAAGFVDLLPEEIAQVEPGDALVMQRAAALLFANDFRKGWSMAEDGSNFTKFKVDKYFERGTTVDTIGEAAAASSKPALEALPLRLHVVLGEKEFTLAEVQSFAPGTIVELETAKSDPVRLMVNGKILGEGELVDVEGSLAVRVLRWRNAG